MINSANEINTKGTVPPLIHWITFSTFFSLVPSPRVLFVLTDETSGKLMSSESSMFFLASCSKHTMIIMRLSLQLIIVCLNYFRLDSQTTLLFADSKTFSVFIVMWCK